MTRNLLFSALATPLLTVAVLAAPQDPQKGASQDPGRDKQHQERMERFLERHPKMKDRVEEWKKLTPEQKRARVEEKLKDHPKLKEKLDALKALTPEQRKEKMQSLRAEHPFAAKRLHRFMMRHPGLRAAFRAYLGGPETTSGR